MVTISNYSEAKNAEGESFFLLEVQGKVEFVKSQTSGRMYATARKTKISSTFDERTCQSLIGQQLPGGIEKVNVEPYSYVIEETGEEIQLSHRWEYNPNLQTMEEAIMGEQLNAQERVIA